MDREITNNTLFNEIIRIDFYKIKDIDSMAQKIQELLTPEKYNFKTVDIRNVNINIEDPETLFTQELIKSNINTTKNYEYISQDENHKFVINEYFVIFEKNNFLTYLDKVNSLYVDALKVAIIHNISFHDQNLIFYLIQNIINSNNLRNVLSNYLKPFFLLFWETHNYLLVA